jgi:tRNA(Glu) U13 pseudouridine synthase TruD
MPRDAKLLWQGDDLELTFALPPGAFATSVLKELLQAPALLPEQAPGDGMLAHPEDDLIEEAG